MADQPQPHHDPSAALPQDRPVSQPDPSLRRNPADLDVHEGQERMQSDHAGAERDRRSAGQGREQE